MRGSLSSAYRRELLVPNKSLPVIIGKKYVTFRELKREAGPDVNIELQKDESEPNSRWNHDPTPILLTGFRSAVDKAADMILSRFAVVYEFDNSMDEDTMPVPSEYRRTLQTLIQEISGKRAVRISLENSLTGLLKVCIRGRKDGIEMAKMDILQEIKPPDDSLEVHVTASVAEKLVDASKGCFKSIAESTGARIEACRTTSSGSLLPLPAEKSEWGEYVVISISGSCAQVSEARTLIIREAQEQARRADSRHRSRSQADYHQPEAKKRPRNAPAGGAYIAKDTGSPTPLTPPRSLTDVAASLLTEESSPGLQKLPEDSTQPAEDSPQPPPSSMEELEAEVHTKDAAAESHAIVQALVKAEATSSWKPTSIIAEPSSPADPKAPPPLAVVVTPPETVESG
jgi:hypothetical protein